MISPEIPGIAFAKKAWEQEGEEVDVLLDQPIREFQAANPNITIERTHDENETLRNQLQAAALAEAAPEVVRVPTDTNHTRIIDLAWDGTPTQEIILSTYSSSNVDLATLGADDLAQIPLLLPK